MLEPIIVDHPTVFPHKCAGCPNTVGPMLDYHLEPNGIRIYLCQRCAKDAAKRFGFVDGQEADARDEAITKATEARRGEAIALESLGKVVQELEESKLLHREKDDTIELLAGHVSQLERTLEESAEAAKAHLALVGNTKS